MEEDYIFIIKYFGCKHTTIKDMAGLMIKYQQMSNSLEGWLVGYL